MLVKMIKFFIGIFFLWFFWFVNADYNYYDFLQPKTYHYDFVANSAWSVLMSSWSYTFLNISYLQKWTASIRVVVYCWNPTLGQKMFDNVWLSSASLNFVYYCNNAIYYTLSWYASWNLAHLIYTFVDSKIDNNKILVNKIKWVIFSEDMQSIYVYFLTFISLLWLLYNSTKFWFKVWFSFLKGKVWKK
jgi:hypothetical protein